MDKSDNGLIEVKKATSREKDKIGHKKQSVTAIYVLIGIVVLATIALFIVAYFSGG